MSLNVRLVWCGVSLLLVLCGPLAAAPTGTPETPAVEPQAAAPAAQAAPVPESVSRSGAPGTLGKSSLPDASIGERNIDLLLDMQGKGAAVFNGPETVNGLPSQRSRGAASAPGRLPVQEPSGDDESTSERAEQDVVLRERHWVSTIAANADAAGHSPSVSSYRGDLDGVDLRRSPFRKLLIFVRDHREWVVAGALAVLLGMMAMGATSRSRRRR